MNAYLVCMLAAVTADPIGEIPVTEKIGAPIYEPLAEFEIAVRGQDPGYGTPTYSDPNYGSPTYSQPGNPAGTYVNPGNPGTIYAPQGNPFFDPFLAPFGAQSQGGFATGLNGPQPYRFGWTSRMDAAFMDAQSTSPAMGKFTQSEIDVNLDYTMPVGPGWIGTFTQQGSWRGWSGPQGAIGLPGSVWHIGWDLELATPQQYGYSFQVAFNPSLNTDFKGTLTSDAWNFDGRAILFIHHSPEWLLALGAGYWDRKDDFIIPYAGVVWTPNNYWELRLLFPESRISYFLGSQDGFAKWMYFTAEYGVESYQVTQQPAEIRNQIQFEDIRLLLGLRADNGFATLFAEAGVVLNRRVRFKMGGPDFDINDGFIGRAGVRF